MFNKILTTEDFQLFSHSTGAKALFCKNNDSNKVFSIAFKTIPQDDKGALHILEHIILMGSKNYRLADPFNELAKSTVYTYLNAITFSDKTVYPVASYIQEDFDSMVDVYLDGVFNPLLRKGAFLQEGINSENYGVVYNEMKGFYESTLESFKADTYRKIFLHNARFSSAGYPRSILGITYEDILAAYRKYYKPSNAYIYFYGDLDTEYYLNYLEKYLLVEKRVWLDDNFKTIGNRRKFIMANRNNEKYISVAFVAGSSTDYRLALALEILKEYLRRTRYFDKYCEEFFVFNETMYRHNIFMVVLKEPKISVAEFEEALLSFSSRELNQGILKECFYWIEFLLKEEFYGIRPRGLGKYFELLDAFLYGDDLQSAVDRQKYLAELDMGAIIKGIILENKKVIYNELVPALVTHRRFEPKIGLCPEGLEEDIAISDENGLGRTENCYTEKKIKPTDIKYFRNNFKNERLEEIGDALYYKLEKDIFYLNLYYELPEINMLYVGLNIKNLNKIGLGSIFFDAEVLNGKIYFTISIKGLISQYKKIIDGLMNTIENFEDVQTSFDISDEIFAGSYYFTNNLVKSYFDKNYTKLDRIKYFGFYDSLKDCFDFNLYKEARRLMFNNRRIIGLACMEAHKKLILDNIPEFKALTYESFNTEVNSEINRRIDIGMNMRTNSAVIKGIEGFLGAKLVLAVLLEKYFLERLVRADGGAYGYGAEVAENGDIVIYSFKDPQARNFYEVRSFLDTLKLSKKEIEGLIVGAMNKLEKPIHASQNLKRLFLRHIQKIDYVALREEILNTDEAIIKRVARVSNIYFAQI